LDPAKKGLEGPVYPSDGFLQGVGTQRNILRKFGFKPGQFVLLVVVSNSLSLSPGPAALFQTGVVQIAVQTIPPLQDLKLRPVGVELVALEVLKGHIQGQRKPTE